MGEIDNIKDQSEVGNGDTNLLEHQLVDLSTVTNEKTIAKFETNAQTSGVSESKIERA